MNDQAVSPSLQLLDSLRAELRAKATPEFAASARRFFKEEVRVYGVPTPVVQALARQYLKTLKGQPKEAVFALCDQLWQAGHLEETSLACEFAHAQRRCFAPEDFPTFERWIREGVTNWAACDTFCNHTVGDFLMDFPQYLQELPRWAASPNQWLRRAAAVSLIVPARKGLWLDLIFALADQLQQDPQDLVQKGYGWALKVASQAHPQEVFNFVLARRQTMPRTAYRYAIEKLPEDLRKRAMER